MDGLVLLENLHRAEQTADEVFAELSFGITTRQATVLMRIGQSVGLSQTGVVEATGIDRSTLADICARLKKRGWISRRRHPQDRRAYTLALTAEGGAILKKVERLDAKLAALLRRRVPGIDGLAPVREAAE